MKRFTACLFALALLCASLVSFDAADAQARELAVKIVNKTDAPVFVCIAGVSGGGEDDSDFVRGWYRVDAGKVKVVKTGFYSPVCEYFYYAENKSKKRFWRSDGRNDFWIHPTNAFRSHPSRKIPGGVRAFFRHLSVSPDGTATLSLTAR